MDRVHDRPKCAMQAAGPSVHLPHCLQAHVLAPEVCTAPCDLESAYHTDLLVLERGVLLNHTSQHVDVDGLVELSGTKCVTNVNMMNFPFRMLWHN